MFLYLIRNKRYTKKILHKKPRSTRTVRSITNRDLLIIDIVYLCVFTETWCNNEEGYFKPCLTI